jgi:DNA-binding CsgD family transcriptional regulator
MYLTISEDGREFLLHIPLTEAHQTMLAVLTPRQKQFMELWGAGKSQKESATEMGITVRGVKYHASEIRRKIQPGA